VIRIAISAEAFDALASTLPLGSVGYEKETNERGERLIWRDHAVLARLKACANRARATATPFSGWRKRRLDELDSAFESPWLTHKRAKHHIRDLKEVVDKFTHEHPWTYVIDADSRAPNLVHKIKFHKLPPADVACILFDTVNNLRATLDQIGYSAALASGKAKPWVIKFLFGDEVKDPAKWTSKDLPAEIVNLFRSDETLQGRQRSASLGDQ
jgi:hypothetical protein